MSFSLYLKNLENIDSKNIDDKFIKDIIKVIHDKAPLIQNKKNEERKKIDPNCKKRKYCRYNPRIIIDVSLKPSEYYNSINLE